MLAKNEAASRVDQVVRETIVDLLDEQGLDNPGVEDEAKLVDTLGLKSMDIAQIVLVLEDELDADPFQEIPITSVRTVADLINAYRVALDPTSAPNAQSDENPVPVAGAARRANRRR
ncbi:MAG: acyl carrier protein [Rhizobiaceae bacterium]